MSVRKAVVLCGGEGTRLRPFSFSVPKHLLPIANRPVLDWILDDLVAAGMREIAVVVSPSTSRALRNALDARSCPGLRLTYAIQEEPGGLAHAVPCARKFVGDDDSLLYLGDNLFERGVGA